MDDEQKLRQAAAWILNSADSCAWDHDVANAVLKLLYEKAALLKVLDAAKAWDRSGRGAGGAVDRTRFTKKALLEAIAVADRVLGGGA